MNNQQKTKQKNKVYCRVSDLANQKTEFITSESIITVWADK